MANNLNPRPIDQIIQDMHKVGFGEVTRRAMIDVFTRIDKVLTDAGEVQAVAPIVGRTEGLGTTAQNLTSVGKLTNTDAIAADGTGSPLTGGKRGFNALDTNNRLASSFNANALNVSLGPTSATVLSNDGVSHVIVIAASTNQFGPGQIAYNSGSADPGVFGNFAITSDDPTFVGSSTYQFTGTAAVTVASDGRLPFGVIHTAVGVPGTGGGDTGGTTPGGEGGRGLSLT